MRYCFWGDQNRKIISSRDVIFNENVVYKGKLEANIEAKKMPTEKKNSVRGHYKRQYCKKKWKSKRHDS